MHLFEAAVDLLSYATYLKCEGKDYRKENLLSLSGVYQPKKELSESKIPIVLMCLMQINRLSERKEDADAKKKCADTFPSE